jgi:protein-tyrosine phosphatase
VYEATLRGLVASHAIDCPRDPEAEASRPFEVVAVCTGNICRSPMAEVLLAAHLRSRGLDAHVRSVGTMAWNGPATPHAVEVMAERGLDLGLHESRQLTREDVERADLVLAMTRDHLWRVARLAPDGESRVFLVPELARLGVAAGGRARDEPVGCWLARVARGRPAAPVVGRADDEIADPFGESIEVYRATASRLDAALDTVAGLLVPAAP